MLLSVWAPVLRVGQGLSVRAGGGRDAEGIWAGVQLQPVPHVRRQQHLQGLEYDDICCNRCPRVVTVKVRKGKMPQVLNT